MGSIVPSSRFLARAVVDQAEIAPGQAILELGAGSGAFSDELVSRYPGNPIILVEVNPDLAEVLRRRFPRARVLATSAEDLLHVAPDLIGRVDRVVSGLPWALWSEARQARVVDGLIPLLAPSSRLATFHYLHSRALGRVKSTRRLFASRFQRVWNSSAVWRNLPPAYIHTAADPREDGALTREAIRAQDRR
jgi:phospholipid N-methyltransferase